MRYLWEHGIDIEQDAVIETAIVHWRKVTGARIDRYTMLKIIIMKYGQELDENNKTHIISEKKKSYPLSSAQPGDHKNGHSGRKESKRG